MNLILVLQIFACFSLSGLIWLIQLVHYPSFRYVDTAEFADFAKFHANKISYIVVPLMLIDFLSSLALISEFGYLHAVLAIVIWFSTALWSVPCHKKLQSKGKDMACIQKLVFSNWPRTIIWSFRSVLWCMYLLKN